MSEDGLSTVHLFFGWDLKNNPIKMRMAESLKLAAEMPDKPFFYSDLLPNLSVALFL